MIKNVLDNLLFAIDGRGPVKPNLKALFTGPLRTQREALTGLLACIASMVGLPECLDRATCSHIASRLSFAAVREALERTCEFFRRVREIVRLPAGSESPALVAIVEYVGYTQTVFGSPLFALYSQRKHDMFKSRDKSLLLSLLLCIRCCLKKVRPRLRVV